jgi:hypothetical protein
MSALLWPGQRRETTGWPVSRVHRHLRGGTMVIVMGGLTQLCCCCHEITERTSDGDRLACSMCGRPYMVTPPAQLMPFTLRPADLLPHDQT